MKDERLAAARAFLQQKGFPLPDDVINGLFDAVKDKSQVVYETGDFVEVNQGMGEIGFGWVRGVEPGGYKIRWWAPKEEDQYTSGCAAGDVRRLSSEGKAQAYDSWRREQ